MNGPGAWDILRRAGLVEGDPPAPAPAESPWFVKIMLGFAGWIAALFLLGFFAIGLSWVIKSQAASFTVGGGLMVAAWWIYRFRTGNEFINQFSLAFSLTGQALFIYAMFELLGPDLDANLAWLLTAALQCALALLMNNPVHRTWSAFAAVACLYAAANDTLLEPLVSAGVLALSAGLWLNEFNQADRGRAFRSIAYGVIAGLVMMDMATGLFRFSLGFGDNRWDVPELAWLGQLLSGVVLLAVVSSLLRRQGLGLTERRSLFWLAVTVLLVLVSLEAPGIAMGICILLLGFAHGNHLLTGFGIFALLTYAGGYYFRLDASLLQKSISLLIIGVTLLVVRLGVKSHE